MLQERITKLLNELTIGINSREDIIKLALLSTLSGETLFLYGNSNIDKNIIGRKLTHAFENSKYFEFRLKSNTNLEEIFTQIRNSNQKIQNSNLIFLDNIFNANFAIQNALLAILDEKSYMDIHSEKKFHFQFVITSSDNLPTRDNCLDALWDRFLIRYVLKPIDDVTTFKQMLLENDDAYEDNVQDDLKITFNEYENWQKKIKNIEIPNYVLDLIVKLKQKIQDRTGQVIATERRWKKIIKFLKTSAFFNDRTHIDVMDFFLVKHCLHYSLDDKEILELEKDILETIKDFDNVFSVDKKLQSHYIYIKSEIENELKKPFTNQNVEQKDLDIKINSWKTELEKVIEKFYSYGEALDYHKNSVEKNIFVESEFKEIVKAKVQEFERNISNSLKETKELQKKLLTFETEKRRNKSENKKIIVNNDEITLKDIFINSIGMEFSLIQAGEFLMGDHFGDGNNDELPIHKVRISKPFYISKFPVTQKNWVDIVKKNPSYFQNNDTHPVENVSWKDVQDFIIKLNNIDTTMQNISKQYQLDPKSTRYRLPTEAEWEYVARSGSNTKYYWGNHFTGECWYDGNSEAKTNPVGLHPPNSWGIFDMIGNVWEWCEDYFDSDYYDRSPLVDPVNKDYSEFCVFRGGSWGNDPWNLRVSYRVKGNQFERFPAVGFRIVFCFS